MKRSGYIVISVVVLILAGLLSLLSWNTVRLYHFQKRQVQVMVESAIKDVADTIQNYNGSLLSTYSSMLTDSNYSSKIAFAAGFTHNMSKVMILFDNDSFAFNEKTAKADASEKRPIIRRSDLARQQVTYDPAKVLNLHDFDSLLGKHLLKEGIQVPYSVHKAKRYEDPAKHIIVSPPFILEFTKPVMYAVHYSIPSAIVLRQMLPYLLSVCCVGLLLFAGSIYLYRSYRLQIQMVQFRESLVGNITHELKTPLSSLQLILDGLAGDATLKQEVTLPAKHLAFANTELKRMKLLVERILSFSKMNAQQLVIDEQQVHLADVVHDALAIMDVQLKEAGATMHADVAASPTVFGDPLLLTNALAAMIDNALKYNAGRLELTIAVIQKGGHAIISVSDNGIGIAKKYRNKIFTPFFRVPSGNLYHTSGHGLGLSLVKQVAALHGGDVSFISGSAGTVFYFKLPVNSK